MRIKDKFTKQDLRKQQKYQRRQKERGLCRLCPERRFRNKQFCMRHYINTRLIAIGTFHGAPTSIWPLKKKKVLSYVNGCFCSAIDQTRPPFVSWKDLHDRLESRFYSELQWRKARFNPRIEALARWIYRWDRRLRRKEGN